MPAQHRVLTLAIASVVVFSAGATAAPRPPTLIAVGDIASCTSEGDEQTAALVSRLRGTIAVLGDIAYDTGSAADFANCFMPSWGRLVPRIRAALGNHEYNTGTAAVAIDRFRLPERGWYSYALGTWHVIVLNSNCSHVGGCGRQSPQWRWLRADLVPTATAARSPTGIIPASARASTGPMRPTLPSGISLQARGRTSSWRDTTTTTSASRRCRASGRSWSARAGKGTHAFRTLRPGSIVRNDDTFGVLELTLRPAGYGWMFRPVQGGTFRDAGTATCR